MVYRYLRGLEGVTPPLALAHLSCQSTAKTFTATRKLAIIVTLFIGVCLAEHIFAVFDRMFSLGLPGSGTGGANPTSMNPRVAGAAPGPRRHFLYCSLKS